MSDAPLDPDGAQAGTADDLQTYFRPRLRGCAAHVSGDAPVARDATESRARLIENLLALYGVQSCSYVLPLITIPYLGHVLGPEGWGSVAIAQSVGAYIALAVEYGFELSATRRIAQCGQDREQMAEVAAGVFGCKALFSAAVIALAALSYPFSGFGGSNGLLWWSALLWGLSAGWSILWFFQGIQRVREAGLLDISAKVLGTVGLFLFVHSPRDGWKILALQGSLTFLSNGAAAVFVYRRIPFIWPSRQFVSRALREGWAMFLFKSSAIAMLSSNTFILGFFAPLERVGWYAAGEKISRSCWQLLTPLAQVLYPKLARLAHVESKQSRSMAVMCTVGTGLIGLSLGFILYAAAPFIVQTLMGKAFMPSVAVLRLLALVSPMVALNSAIAFYWLFPASLEGPYTWLVIGGLAVDVILNVALARQLAEIGTALAVMGAEATILGGAFLLLRSRLRSGFPGLPAVGALTVSAHGGE